MKENNLINLADRPEEERKEIAKKGQKASVEAKKEKKLMSVLYAEYLAKEHNVISKDGTKKQVTAEEFFHGIVNKVLSRGDSSSVRLMKEIREATEGQNIKLSGEINIDIESRREALKEKLKTIANNRTDKA